MTNAKARRPGRTRGIVGHGPVQLSPHDEALRVRQDRTAIRNRRALRRWPRARALAWRSGRGRVRVVFAFRGLGRYVVTMMRLFSRSCPRGAKAMKRRKDAASRSRRRSPALRACGESQRERHARLCRPDFVWQHFPARRERQPVHRAAAIRDRASDNRIRSASERPTGVIRATADHVRG
jgi:hypothetical protein